MKISVQEFRNAEGISFYIFTKDATEAALLNACVDNTILRNTDDENMFELILPVLQEA